MRDGFIKVAAGTPKIKVADCRYNAEQVFAMMREAAGQGVRVLVLPELCLTGSTCGDLFRQETLLRSAEEGLRTVLEATRPLDLVAVVGLPVRGRGKLYNCAAVIQSGVILGLVPCTCPTQEASRWFSPASGDFGFPLTFAGQENTLLSARQIFTCETMPELTFGVEVGQDLWAFDGPGTALARHGAAVILAPGADCELVCRARERRGQVVSASSRLVCGCVYAGAGEGESTTDKVFSGHCLIAENGELLAERRYAPGFAVTELDVRKLAQERRVRPDFPERRDGWACPSFSLESATTVLTRHIEPNPFLPENEAERTERCAEILKIAAMGLKKRMEHTNAATAVIGLSGGLDSTLAILTTALTMKLLDRPASDIVAVTMPCFGTTERTRDNAVELAECLGATLRRIDISDTVRSHFRDIGQSIDDHDVTYENAQARERTQVIMDIANQTGGMVIGTGDLSELALGWCTYNGDHMSMYAVNAGIPKTMVRALVRYIAEDPAWGNERLTTVLLDILDTPVSPELLPAVGGKISQKTEDLVGPYELHDFFLYYTLRWGFSPRKILRLAEQAFAREYDRAVILSWLRTFFRRFLSQQFKRSCLPDGPKVGTVGISPRGDLCMPSDAVSRVWLEELEELG